MKAALFGEHPTGKRVQVMGMTHYHYKNGKIVDEWNVYDELSLLTQVKLAQLTDAPAAERESAGRLVATGSAL